MDFKSSVACGLSHSVDTYTETIPCTASATNLSDDSSTNPLNSGQCRNFGKSDALEAVKLDPAVLEAQVTVENKRKATEPKKSHEDVGAAADGEEAAPSSFAGFEDMVSQHEAALLSLTPDRLELFMAYADMLRKQRMATQKTTECVFCKNNGKSLYWYTSHTLRDGRGRVQCPVLRSFRCPRCGATGDRAHTIKYCPEHDTDTRSSTS